MSYRSWSIATVVFSFVISGCLQKNNSFSNDANNFAPASGSETFLSVKEILRQNCQSCHPSFMAMSEEEFLRTKSASGFALIKGGDPQHSEIFKRLQGAGGSMPLNATISPAEVATIREWIQSVEPLREEAGANRFARKAPPLAVPAPNPSDEGNPPTEPPMESPTERFVAVKNILTRAGSCVMCHAANIAQYSEEDFRTKATVQGEKLVVPGKAAASALFKKLRGSGVSKTFATMPPAPLPALSEEDLSIIRRWIEEMPSQAAAPTHFPPDWINDPPPISPEPQTEGENEPTADPTEST